MTYLLKRHLRTLFSSSDYFDTWFFDIWFITNETFRAALFYQLMLYLNTSLDTGH